MASSPLTPIVSGFNVTTSWQTLYTVPNDVLRAGVDAVVFNNYAAAGNVSYSVRITQSGASTSFDEVITDLNIAKGKNDLGIAMIGQAILAGGTIQAKASANSSISATITATIVDS